MGRVRISLYIMEIDSVFCTLQAILDAFRKYFPLISSNFSFERKKFLRLLNLAEQNVCLCNQNFVCVRVRAYVCVYVCMQT